LEPLAAPTLGAREAFDGGTEATGKEEDELRCLPSVCFFAWSLARASVRLGNVVAEGAPSSPALPSSEDLSSNSTSSSPYSSEGIDLAHPLWLAAKGLSSIAFGDKGRDFAMEAFVELEYDGLLGSGFCFVLDESLSC
jgi:hypothetical protein